jgi:hypothetical protein
LPADVCGGRAVLLIAGVIEHEHAVAVGRRGRLALQQPKPPRIQRLSAPVRFREKVLQALDLRALRLHHRFRAGQRRERLVAIARGKQSAQVVAKAAALAERTKQRVKLRRKPLQRPQGRRTRLTGGHRNVPPMPPSYTPCPLQQTTDSGRAGSQGFFGA